MGHGHYILAEDGKTPLRIDDADVISWARMFEKTDRRVALTERDGIKVSTVFLGLDHNFAPDGEPLLFETMVFGGPLDQEQDRYGTWDEAAAGHEAMVKRVWPDGT